MFVNDNSVDFVDFVEKTADLLVKQQNFCTKELSIGISEDQNARSHSAE